MLGTPNPHRRLRLRMASERMFDAFDEASCQVSRVVFMSVFPCDLDYAILEL
jgi:hypothetical protein